MCSIIVLRAVEVLDYGADCDCVPEQARRQVKKKRRRNVKCSGGSNIAIWVLAQINKASINATAIRRGHTVYCSYCTFGHDPILIKKPKRALDIPRGACCCACCSPSVLGSARRPACRMSRACGCTVPAKHICARGSTSYFFTAPRVL